ncbi:dUTP diphosphatase [Patescibacteria group bacterium]|nr:dUTP diphosphatase [Patescibacteria group bacterium]
MTIQFMKLSEKAITPSQAYLYDAAYDLHSTEEYILQPGERHHFPTHIACRVPQGYYGRIAPRSGLAFKHGIDVLAGVVDHSYTGDIGVILINFGEQPYEVKT